METTRPRGRRAIAFRRPSLRRPSPALVVAAFALVMSVAGNAAAAVIISTNHQVAAHTISGAAGPSTDNKNLIPGSVGTSDLHAGAVTPTVLSNDARAHKIDFIRTGTVNDTVTLLKLDQLTIKGGCFSESGDSAFAPFRLISTVNADVNWSYNEDKGGTTTPHAGGSAMTANNQFDPFGYPAATSTGPDDRLEGQLVYANSTRVITVTFHVISEYDLNSLCEATGTAVVATKG